jgi:hypothetical protein
VAHNIPLAASAASKQSAQAAKGAVQGEDMHPRSILQVSVPCDRSTQLQQEHTGDVMMMLIAAAMAVELPPPPLSPLSPHCNVTCATPRTPAHILHTGPRRNRVGG